MHLAALFQRKGGRVTYAVTELSSVEEGGVRSVEGVPGERFIARPDEASRIVEACFNARTRAALLYADNLTPAFSDLSSGEAGLVLEKLRQYRIRLAVVCPPGTAQFSSRFGELVAERRSASYFDVFETRAAARDWLARVAVA